MQTLILGAGAVGGYIGMKLIEAGSDVMFIARRDRLKQLSQKGLVVRSPLGNRATQVVASEHPASDFVPDVVILACKAPALHGAIATVKPNVSKDTLILPVLNGVSHIETLHQVFPDNPILGGIVHGALTLTPEGTIDHLSPFFTFIVGRTSGAVDTATQSLIQTLANSQVDARLSSDIQQDLWSKFVFLTSLAGITCLMRASIGTIMASVDGPRLTRQLFGECLNVAQLEDRATDAEALNAYLALLTQSGSNLTSSMLRDIASGRRTEYEHILGDMLRRAQLYGLDTPILRICATHLACYEARFVAEPPRAII
jgi:2-dehydropantoate 2-reductase